MLKNILSLLLSKFYSKQESEAVGHQALPASSYTTLFTNKTITSWGAVASGVAANDGYLKLQSNGSGSTTAALMVMTPHLTSVIQYPFETAGISAWVPIAKGETWKVQGSDSTSINLYLYKTIGGGVQSLKNDLLQGGGLCLNSLSSSLRRSSWLARRSGSEVKVFSQIQIPEQRSLLATFRLCFTRLRVMDGLPSAETDHRLMSALPENWECVALILKVISELQLRFGREVPLVSIARRRMGNRLRLSSSRAKGRRSPSLVGGASC